MIACMCTDRMNPTFLYFKLRFQTECPMTRMRFPPGRLRDCRMECYSRIQCKGLVAREMTNRDHISVTFTDTHGGRVDTSKHSVNPGSHCKRIGVLSLEIYLRTYLRGDKKSGKPLTLITPTKRFISGGTCAGVRLVVIRRLPQASGCIRYDFSLLAEYRSMGITAHPKPIPKSSSFI